MPLRILTLQDGTKVKSLDNEQRTLTYLIIDSPMSIKNYTGTMQVHQLEDNNSEFVWSSTFDAA